MAGPAQTRENRDPEARHVFQARFKGKAITWMETVAARHGMDTSAFARELFALGSVEWQRRHPQDIDPAAQQA